MLTDLQITNFAIIESQTVSFGPGLNVISGETGAGKSVILSAIELVLGGRASAQVVREGAEALEVHAVFDLKNLAESVRRDLPEYITGDELHIARSVSESGKGKVFINGKLASVALLQEVVGKLVSLCKQGQQMRLLDRAYHTEIIDLFGGLGDERERFQQSYRQWIHERDLYLSLKQRAEEGESRREDLNDRIKEISAAEPEAGLRERLEQQLKVVRSGGRLLEGYQGILDALSGDQAVLPLLKRIGAEIDKLNAVDPRSRELREGLELVRSAAMDFEAAVSERATGISLNEEELETLEQRLTELARLQRKYRVDDRGLVELLEAYRGELRSIEDIEQLELRAKKVNELEKNVSALAEALAEKRRSVGESLSKLVEPELKELNMPHARLAVQATRGQLSIQGMDTLELMISSNKGEALKPLKQVASGGELSRVLLVLKKVLQERSGVHVLIFDEIDAGVSGGVARAVGEKLKALSEHSQVLCITHLPQIASLADNHLLVEKKIGGKRTVSVVKELVGDEKVDEIARMLAGYKVTSASRESARELLSSKKR